MPLQPVVLPAAGHPSILLRTHGLPGHRCAWPAAFTASVGSASFSNNYKVVVCEHTKGTRDGGNSSALAFLCPKPAWPSSPRAHLVWMSTHQMSTHQRRCKCRFREAVTHRPSAWPWHAVGATDYVMPAPIQPLQCGRSLFAWCCLVPSHLYCLAHAHGHALPHGCCTRPPWQCSRIPTFQASSTSPLSCRCCLSTSWHTGRLRQRLHLS